MWVLGFITAKTFPFKFFLKEKTSDKNKEINSLLKASEQKKKIVIIRKDEFDKKHANLVETGFLSPLEYYRLKSFFLKNSLNF